MERKLYFGIMTPGAMLTVVFGLWMWLGYGVTGGWLHAKVAFVLRADRVSRLPGHAAARFRARPQPARPRVLSLAERDSRAAAARRHRLARRREAVLTQPASRHSRRMSERFFAPCPRGLEAPLAAELAAIGATDVAPADGGVAFAGDARARLSREPRIAHRQPHPVARRRRPYRDEHDLYELVHAHRLVAPFRADAHAARRRRGDALAADEPRVRDAADQGRRVRPDARGSRRPAVDRQARARRARARPPDRPRRDDLRRHVGRAAVQARLSAGCGRGAAAREPRGRPAGAGAMDAGHAAARSDVRQRNDRRPRPR